MNDKGKQGEAQAAEYLKKQGYKILALNFPSRFGELDIVAQYKKTLVFVEVKMRSYSAFGGPLAAVGKAKQDKIAATAICYVKEKNPKFDSIRFDIITVLEGKVDHIENAFTPNRGTF
ncbi:putative endonuclease [Elusimicrobium posterum]|uniref:YraN family protein n=1 Tax=Elusimicrobium posterum TaxID=3116653 RepID=UPI003C77E84E